MRITVFLFSFLSFARVQSRDRIIMSMFEKPLFPYSLLFLRYSPYDPSNSGDSTPQYVHRYVQQTHTHISTVTHPKKYTFSLTSKPTLATFPRLRAYLLSVCTHQYRRFSPKRAHSRYSYYCWSEYAPWMSYSVKCTLRIPIMTITPPSRLPIFVSYSNICTLEPYRPYRPSIHPSIQPVIPRPSSSPWSSSAFVLLFRVQRNLCERFRDAQTHSHDLLYTHKKNTTTIRCRKLSERWRRWLEVSNHRRVHSKYCLRCWLSCVCVVCDVDDEDEACWRCTSPKLEANATFRDFNILSARLDVRTHRNTP